MKKEDDLLKEILETEQQIKKISSKEIKTKPSYLISAETLLNMDADDTTKIGATYGLKIIAETKHGGINTWHDVVNPKTIEEIINENKEWKNWIGGKITEAYLEITVNGKYTKIWIDVKKHKFNNLLKP